MLKKIGLGLLAVLIIIQFFRPEKNDSPDTEFDIHTAYQIPDEVEKMLKVACNDCHSNHTRYPWYSHIQPVAWWLNDHVEHGKRHLNFSDFTSRPIAVQNHKLEEIIETVESHEMPLSSYTLFGLHSDADLSEEQRALMISWAKGEMDRLAAEYPADSLVMRRRR